MTYNLGDTMKVTQVMLHEAAKINSTLKYPRTLWRAIQKQIGAKPDGKPGPKTAKAIFRWQEQWGLQPHHIDGVCGRTTMLTLGRGKGLFPTAMLTPESVEASYEDVPLTIDVSTYQGTVQWPYVEEVLEEEVPIFVRLLKGSLKPDKRARANRKARNGVGYVPVKMTKYSAKHFVTSLLAVLPEDWGIAIDCEHKAVLEADKKDSKLDSDWLLEAAVLAISERDDVWVYASYRCQKLLGQECMDELEAMGVKLWVPDYSLTGDSPKRLPGLEWYAWQFCCVGHVSGIQGCVDLNLLNKEAP